jgi:hypothetical protein
LKELTDRTYGRGAIRIMRTRIVSTALTAAALICVMTLTAHAQTTMDLSTIDLGIQQIQQNTFLFDSIDRSMAVTPGAEGSGRKTAGAPRSTTGIPRTPVAAGATTFRPVAVSIMPQRLAAQMGRTPAERDRLEKFFTLLLTDYKEMAVERGAPLNDVARASTLCPKIQPEN